MKFQLIAKVRDSDLFRKITHELGTLFYVEERDSLVKAVYFSGSKLAVYSGKFDEDLAKLIRATGHRVDEIEVDEAQGVLRITQVQPESEAE